MSLAAVLQDSPKLPKILVVEDDPSLREALADTLSLADYEPHTAPNAETALTMLADIQDIAMVVSDVNMGNLSGHDLLKQIKISYPHIPMLLVTAYASVRESVDAMRQGAVDYLVKPFEPQALVDIVKRHVNGVTDSGNDEPIAQAPSSCQLLHLARRVAQSDSTVLILGESGTGKEVLARYVHHQSPRSDKPFIAINCAAIPENMLEAILFGYEKGAYTGAYTSAPGKFEQANGGTLLLDEISEMAIGLQAKLLRVIQEQEVERLGGRKTIPLNVRLIATSNRDMRQQVAEGGFREDLFYRLSVLPLVWKPLRERREDIIPLAQKLLQKHTLKQGRSGVTFSSSAQQALLTYHWPGNVRELDNAVQRSLILQMGQEITEQDLGLDQDIYGAAQVVMDNQAQMSAITPEPNSLESLDKQAQLGEDLKKREFEIILDTLRQEQGSRKRTAERLGISPRTLRYKLAGMREVGMEI